MTSLPPRAWITSSPEVPTMTSSPSVPTIVARRSSSPTQVTPRPDEAWKGLRPTKDFRGASDRREGEVKRGRLQTIDLGGKHVEDVPDIRLELREDLRIEVCLPLGVVGDDQRRHHYASCGIR